MLINDHQKKLAYRKVFGLEEPEISVLSWDSLHDWHSRISDKYEDLLTRAQGDKRDLTEQEETGCTYADALLKSINNEFERRDRHNTKEPLEPVRGITRVNIQDGLASPHDGENKRAGLIKCSYRDLFCEGNRNVALDRGDFKSLNEFFRSVHSGRHDPRLESRSMITGVGSLGGFSIPETWLEQIWSIPLEESIIMSRAQKFPITQGNSIHVPFWENQDHTNNVYGGFWLTWMAEEGTQTDQDAAMNSLDLGAEKCGIYTSCSNQLLLDGINFERQLGDVMSKALTFGLDAVFLYEGNGVAKPQSVFNAGSRITVGRNTANSVKYVDVASMIGRLHPACYRNAIWVCAPSVLPQLTQMTDTAGNLCWVANASQSAPGRIFGIEVLPSEKLPSLGNEGDLMLVDPSQYNIVIRKELAIEKTNAVGWYQDKSNFRIIARLNGWPMWADPVTPRGGGDTLSWAIVLQ